MNASFRNSAFISYSSQDRAWAEMIYDNLKDRGIDSFLDRQRLVPGRAWERQLKEALNDSRHLVVFWSTAAKDSDWVREECGRFSQIADPGGTGLTGERGIFAILLEGVNAALATTQMVSDVAAGGWYPGDPADVPQDAWRAVVDRIAAAIHSEDGAIPIPILLMTSTVDRIRAIDPLRVPAEGPALGELLAELDISVERFQASYGAARRDWHPFGSDQTIDEILMTLKATLNREIDEASRVHGESLPRFRWDYVPEEFWSAFDVAERESSRLAQGPVVVVVDPLSFYDELVLNRYTNQVSEIFNNDAAFILVLSPFSPSPSVLALREALRRIAHQVFTHFYQPPAFKGRAYARCGPSVGDPLEFKGWLTAALAAHIGLVRTARHPFLEVGVRGR